MSLLIIAISFVVLLVIAYRSYGSFIARSLGINDTQITPAHRHADGVDFIPTRPFYLFAQHFSAISAAGPIAGPIMACLLWGWLPCLLWIAIGVVLIGAMHDFLSLLISVRHGGVSVAIIAKETLGSRAGLAMMLFIWLSLIYVIVAFTDLSAGSFVNSSEELSALATNFNPGGAVAMAAVLYLFLSLIMGLTERFLKPKLWVSTLVFVPLAFATVWLGTRYSTVFLFDLKIWCLLILVYCFVSSLLPVWLLLQPRGYLGGFILYSALAIGFCGMLFGNFPIKQAAWKTWDSGTMTGALFPFLFVTIACGACSGFHGLVCSGTTAKQIDKESDMKAVGYGAMLCEAMVALIALATVMIWSETEIAGLRPGAIYGKGLGQFLSMMVGEKYLHVATTFGAMAFSTFVFDTLDVSTRLGRYLLQELLQLKKLAGAIFCTLLTVGIPMIFISFSEAGSYLRFWTLFGASNQLLAALTMLSITVWLSKHRRKTYFVMLPMLFVLIITGWALIDLAFTNFSTNNSIDIINGLISLSLIFLAIFLIINALIRMRSASIAWT